MSWAKAYTYTPDASKAGTIDQANFPVRIKVTHNDLRTIANGGIVNDGTKDIAFYDTVAAGTLLDFERDFYDPVTGTIWAWVRQSVLSHTAGIPFVMLYGNAAIVADLSNPTGVWNSHVLGRYGFSNDGGATLNVNDSTANANHVSANGTGVGVSNTGPVGPAATFNGTTQYLRRLANALKTTEPLHMTAWFNPTAAVDATIVGQAIQAVSSVASEIRQKLTSQFITTVTGTISATSGNAYTLNAWNYVSGRCVAAASRFIRLNNGAAVQNVTNQVFPTPDDFYIGVRYANGLLSNFFPGAIAEVRFYDQDMGVDWEVAEFNSVNNPATFAVESGPTVLTGTLAFSQQPSTVASGAVNAPSIAVQLSDNASGVTVTLALNTGLGNLSGTLTAVSNGTGLVTFANVKTNGAGTHKLTASAPGYTNQNSNNYNVTNARTAIIQAFINNHGNDPAWLGFCDFLTNHNDDGSGRALQLNDARGSGVTSIFPATQATQSKRYTINADGLTGTRAALSHYITALDTRVKLLNPTALHAFVVLKNPDANGFPIIISVDPTDLTVEPYMALTTDATNYGAQVNPGPALTTNQTNFSTDLPFDGTLRALRLSRRKNFSPTIGIGDECFQVQCDGAPSRQKLTVPAISATAGGMAFCIGRAGATYCGLTVQAIAISTRSLDTDPTLRADWSALVTTLYPAAVPDLRAKGLCLNTGSSVPRGHNTTHPHGINGTDDGSTAPPKFWAATCATLAARGYEHSNIDSYSPASNGREVVGEIATINDAIGWDIDPRRGGHFIISEELWVNTFRLTYTGVNGHLNAWANLVTLCTNLVALGIDKIVLKTCIDWGDWYTPAATGALNQKGLNAKNFNIKAIAEWNTLPGVVALINYDLLDPVLLRFMVDRASLVPAIGTNATADVTYYLNGNWHPTDTGAALLGTLEGGFYDANANAIFGRLAKFGVGFVGVGVTA